MVLKAKIMDELQIERALIRISHEIIERNSGTERLLLVGIKTRGVPLAKRIQANIAKAYGVEVPVGVMDITRYRDDVESDDMPKSMDIPVDIENKKVVLVDDVLFTGRTVRAAIEGIIAEGRPSCIQLAVLVDRGHRELPIRADFVGKNLPTSLSEIVSVNLAENDGENSVALYDMAE